MNTHEELFHMLLGLGDEWRIIELEFDREIGEVRLRIVDRPDYLRWLVR